MAVYLGKRENHFINKAVQPTEERKVDYTNEQLAEIIAKHRLWLLGEESGSRANLSRANLSRANLSRANLSRANLDGANLSRANLSRANLDGANLDGVRSFNSASGNRREVKALQCDTYAVTYTVDRMQIGCQIHAINEWWAFGDEEILQMDGRTSLKWWRVWKPILQQIIETSPATAHAGTKPEEQAKAAE